ncbi:unnamed protein product, partial [marine sediment metagenome]
MCLISYKKEDLQNEILKTGVYGAFLFPPTWVGKYPFKNLEDKLKGIITLADNIILEYQFNEHKVILTETGKILVYCEEKEKALKIINSLLGILSYFGAIFESIGVTELEEWQLDEKGECKSVLLAIAERRGWTFPKFHIKYDDFKYYYRICSIDEMKKRLDEAQSIPNIIYHYFELYIEMKSLYANKSFNSSFLIGWSFVESLLNLIWSNYLDVKWTKQINNMRRKNMKESKDWTISIKIDTMQLCGLIKKNI